MNWIIRESNKADNPDYYKKPIIKNEIEVDNKNYELNHYPNFLEVIGVFIQDIANFINIVIKFLFVRIPLTIVGVLLIIAGVILTISWIGFVFGSVIGAVLLVIFCLDCFLLPLAISALGIALISYAWG